jgi:hypothetical protein
LLLQAFGSIAIPPTSHQELQWQIPRQPVNGLNLLIGKGFCAKNRYATVCSLQLLSTSFAEVLGSLFPTDVLRQRGKNLHARHCRTRCSDCLVKIEPPAMGLRSLTLL